MVAIHQLARSVQGVKLLNNSGSSVGPLVSAVEGVISCVGALLSVCTATLVPGPWSQKPAKETGKMFHTAGPVLRPCAVEALQGGGASPSDLPAQADKQINKEKSQTK